MPPGLRDPRDSRPPLLDSLALKGGVLEAGGEFPSPDVPLMSVDRMMVTGLAIGPVGGGGGGSMELL